MNINKNQNLKRLSVSRTANSNLQNRINISIIFNYLREVGPTYRAKISKDLKISAPAVSRAIENLIAHGYVIEKERIKTSYGGKATEIMVNLEKGTVIGIDLLKEHLKIAIFNFNGDLLYKYSGVKLAESKRIGKDLVDEIDKFLGLYAKNNPNKNRFPELQAICVGVPATVDDVTGSVLKLNLYENLQGENLKELLTKRYNVQVYVENDSKLSALSEKEYGHGKNYKDLVFVEISNGIGAGIILDNNIVKGNEGFAGEIGSLILSPKNFDFERKNNKGYLESTASVENLSVRAIEEIGRGVKSILPELAQREKADISPSTVCMAALQGDELAVSIVNDMVDAISLAILNLVLILNPGIIILGGDICHLPGVDTLFVETITKKIKNIVPFKVPEIKLSMLGEDAGVIGASYLAREMLLIGKYPYKIDT